VPNAFERISAAPYLIQAQLDITVIGNCMAAAVVARWEGVLKSSA
jgi:hypothetical protein